MELIIYPAQTTAVRFTLVPQNKTTQHKIQQISTLEILMRLA
ncbi:hypothetical protein [Phormidium nigroviride]